MFSRSRTLGVMAGLASLTMVAAACGSSSPASSSATTTAAPANNTPVKIGMVTELTGLFAAYTQEYQQGFKIGLDYATNGTDKVNGHPIDVTWQDDADSATTAVADFKSLVGAGYKIFGGTVDSGIATQLAPLAAQNQVLYVSGPAAADQVTGLNRYTFRSGRQTYQDVLTAKSYVASAGSGQTIVVLAQDYAFGQSYVTDAQQVFGPLGDTVKPVLVPLSTTDFTPTALQVKALHPNLVFLAWAGATGSALAQALDQQGVFDNVKVVTGLANIATYPFYGPTGTKFDYLSLYFYQAAHNAANDYLIQQMKARYNSVPDLFTPDGFVAAQMMVHAIQAGGGTDVNAMIKALQGWTFLAPKGKQTIRPSDHAMLQPMFQAKLTQSGSTYTPQLVQALPDSATAPPITAHFGS
ncbi:MAG: substrate-binding domain-containing protein [Actinomycetota bacterium]|nr:substrate-binding domain-containing protein [Actinomycetota bacterium]MDA8207687.1 substrate-binding domain-containing protein [Actinomycetota bacterium]